MPCPSTTAKAVPSARKLTTIPDLAVLARNLHAQGVYLIARIVVFKDAWAQPSNRRTGSVTSHAWSSGASQGALC